MKTIFLIWGKERASDYCPKRCEILWLRVPFSQHDLENTCIATKAILRNIFKQYRVQNKLGYLFASFIDNIELLLGSIIRVLIEQKGEQLQKYAVEAKKK